MKIEFCGLLDKGCKRTQNQDRILMRSSQDMGLFMVADGMGGHSQGEKASSMLAQYLDMTWNEIQEQKEKIDFQQLILMLQKSLQNANEQIYSQYNSDSICGSTVTALFLYQNKYCMFHCGDSRLYCMKRFRLEQLSMDDVWENQSDVVQKLSSKQIKTNFNKGKLVRAVGTSNNLEVTVETNKLTGNECFLLCSDGLYKMIDKRLMQKAIRRYKKGQDGKEVLKKLLQSVYKEGAEDNISVIFVKL